MVNNFARSACSPSTIYDDLVGTPIGSHLRIVEKIASDGVSTIYRAMDLASTREVAIKVMHLEHVPDAVRPSVSPVAAAYEVAPTPRMSWPYQPGLDDGRSMTYPQSWKSLPSLPSLQAAHRPVEALRLWTKLLLAVFAIALGIVLGLIAISLERGSSGAGNDALGASWR